LGYYFGRLEVHAILPTDAVTDIFVKIFVELFLVLALATMRIRQGLFEKFLKKLRGKDETRAALERLERLTGDEVLSVAARTF